MMESNQCKRDGEAAVVSKLEQLLGEECQIAAAESTVTTDRTARNARQWFAVPLKNAIDFTRRLKRNTRSKFS